ncbi:MAG: DNA repair protein RecN [Williamsia sp.]|nr:DNA repair protein RecN [Williamsia sp.]
MLQQLYIQNYAIIDEIRVEFSGKLNIITGETGAGKSILIGALSLILGDRADTGVLLNRDKKCFVEGYFKVNGKKEILRFLKDNDLDIEDQLVIRREIAASGKSRAFINDTPVNLGQLQQLSSSLVDLHQQFDTLEMQESDFQREVVDALANNTTGLAKYQTVYKQLQAARKSLAALQEQKSSFNKEFDYTQFLHQELQDANFTPNELEDAEAEIKLLSNVEGIKGALSKALFQLKEGDEPVVQQLKTLVHQLQSYADFHPDLSAVVQRLQSAQIELQDISNEADRINDQINYDPQRIEEINERLSLGYKLLKKHGLQTTDELLALKNSLEQKLQGVLNIDEALQKGEKEVEQLQAQAARMAEDLSARRQKQARPLEEKVNALLRQVGMPNARLKVEIKQFNSLQPFGTDNIEFLFDANRSNQFAPIRRVASGGELSRLMLCIKSLVAQYVDLPTMIFDEIDTGISGEAARQVGFIMKDLAASRQIICITHQPQMAGRADAHFYVYKKAQQNTVKTDIKLLSPDERILTIAQMLSGEKPTAAALENARELVNGG